MLIRSSLLWLTSDQVFLFDVQRSTSGYCMREYKHAYCFSQSYSASSSVQSQPECQWHVPFQHSRTRVLDLRTRERRGFCTLVHSLCIETLVGHVMCLTGLIAAEFKSSEPLHLLGLNGRVGAIPT